MRRDNKRVALKIPAEATAAFSRVQPFTPIAQRRCVLRPMVPMRSQRSLDSKRFIMFYCRKPWVQRLRSRSGFGKSTKQILKSSDAALIEAEQGGGT